MNSSNSENKRNFALTRENYILLAVGFVIVVTGFLLMIGGGSKPDEFHADKLFSFRRITLAPMVILIGFAFEIYAIMKKPKNKEEDK